MMYITSHLVSVMVNPITYMMRMDRVWGWTSSFNADIVVNKQHLVCNANNNCIFVF